MPEMTQKVGKHQIIVMKTHGQVILMVKKENTADVQCNVPMTKDESIALAHALLTAAEAG